MILLGDLATPALLLDLDVLERNLAAMARRCAALGVGLRPHIKTHKCVEIAGRQRALGAQGLTVSTLEEARDFAAAGFDDVTWAFPVILGRLPEARSLIEAHEGRLSLRVVVDSHAAADALEAERFPFSVWLKVDCGYHRCGVDPEGPLARELARHLAASPSLTFDGLLTHSGHAYQAAGRPALARIAEGERAVVAGLAAALREEGVEVRGVSVGSTPAMSSARALEGVTEARPGNYAFYDGSQVARGACGTEDCALTVLASVVSCQPGAAHCVVDAGALSLSKDAGFGETGMGRLLAADGRPSGARLTALSQEHGVVDRPYAVGQRVRILANHSCLAVPCFDRYHVVSGDRVVARWPILRGR